MRVLAQKWHRHMLHHVNECCVDHWKVGVFGMNYIVGTNALKAGTNSLSEFQVVVF
jgi:hypothetical protein